MRHQIRAMLHQLAESGRLGTPASARETEREDDESVERAVQAGKASSLRKAQAQAASRQG